MRVGFGSITCQRFPGEEASDVDVYQRALVVACEAERLGWDSFWLSEHHFFDDSYLPSVLPFAAAIAARTERITIGTDVALAPLYEPIRLAEDAATVDLLSRGRFVLGLAQGWRAEEFEALRVPLRGRHRRLEDTVTVLREAWSDGLVRGGDVVSYPGVGVTPKPFRAGGPPIWIGGTSESAVRRAGRMADGFVASWGDRETFARQVAWARDEAAKAGRPADRFTIALVLPAFAWEGEDAWTRIRDHFHYYAWKYEDMAEARGRTGPPPRPPTPTGEREAELRSLALVGDPDHLVERLLAFQEAAGGELHFIAEFFWPGLDHGVLREAMEVFAERVIPRLR